MWKRILALALTAGLALSLTACKGSGSSEQPDTAGSSVQNETTEVGTDLLRLGVYTGGVDHFIAVIGQQTGIFESHGLQVEMTEFASGINTVDAMVTGQSDMGLITDYAGINRIGSTKDSCDIKILARYTTSKDYWTLYANPEQVKTPADLAGKGVGNIQGTILDYYNAILFESAGIGEDDRNLVNVDSEQTALAALSDGEAAAYWTSRAATEKVEEMGLEKLLTMDDLGLTVDAYYVASNEFLKQHEDTAEKFLAAVKEIEQWISKNQDEAVKILADTLHIPEAQATASLESNQLVLDFDQDSIDHLTAIKDWALQTGNFSHDFEITDFVDTTALEHSK